MFASLQVQRKLFYLLCRAAQDCHAFPGQRPVTQHTGKYLAAPSWHTAAFACCCSQAAQRHSKRAARTEELTEGKNSPPLPQRFSTAAGIIKAAHSTDIMLAQSQLMTADELASLKKPRVLIGSLHLESLASLLLGRPVFSQRSRKQARFWGTGTAPYRVSHCSWGM